MNSLAETPEQGVGNLTPWFVGAGLALGAGAVAYALNRESPSEALQKASLLPYVKDIAAVLNVLKGEDYAVVGGLPIDAFNDPGSTIDTENHTITVSREFDTKLLREKNNTIRDLDNFILFKDADGNFCQPDAVELESLKKNLRARAKARAYTQHEPTPRVSVFSFDNKKSLIYTATMLDEDGSVYLRQGYTEQALPDDALETWELILPGGVHVRILNPWEQYWRSMTRFSSGVKSKDIPKLTTMLDKLLMTPGLDELRDSPLCLAYRDYLQNMLQGNSLEALKDELSSPNPRLGKSAYLGLLVTARTILGAAEQVSFLSKIVQQTPEVFDLFVGG